MIKENSISTNFFWLLPQQTFLRQVRRSRHSPRALFYTFYIYVMLVEDEETK
jgi:hypothetical protein